MASTVRCLDGPTRRAVLGRGGAAGAAAFAAACSPRVGGQEGPAAAIGGPREMTWSCYQLGEARQRLWDETFALAGEVGTREAMRESAEALNQLFSRRPAAWK